MLKHLFFFCLIISCVEKTCALTTANIVTETLAATPSCLYYQVKGLCYWLDEKGMSTTLEISHYLPDLVVTVYEQVGGDPWVEANTAYDQAAFKVANAQTSTLMPGFHLAGGNGSAGDQVKTDLHLFEVDVIGNPTLNHLITQEILLPTTATSFVPYFQSLLDAAAWRTPPVEIALYPEYLAPGLHDIGQWPVNTWGLVYPRTGFIIQQNEAKAAAVIALRAAHIVTRENQPHIYKVLNSDCGIHCTASVVTENNEDIHWQMIYPMASHSCDVFGKNDDGSQEWEQAVEQQAHGAYVFNLWRRYQGCIQGHGQYMGSVEF